MQKQLSADNFCKQFDGQSGSEVIKLFSCSTKLSMKFIMLIKVKISTIVGFLTFMSMINTTPESLKTGKDFIFKSFQVSEHLKFTLSWVKHEKSFITSGLGPKVWHYGSQLWLSP